MFLSALFLPVGTIIITGSGLFQVTVLFFGKFLDFWLLCISIVYIFASKLRKVPTRSIIQNYYILLQLFFFNFYIVVKTFFQSLKLNLNGLLALGIIPTILGHSLFYYSIKYTSPTIVASFLSVNRYCFCFCLVFVFRDCFHYYFYWWNIYTCRGLFFGRVFTVQ